MKVIKKLICVIITAAVFVLALPLTVHAKIQRDGDIVCELDESTGVVTISGNGALTDYPSHYNWYGRTGIGFDAAAIKSVIVNEGVTKIGWNSFYNCPNLTSVKLPNSVTEISNNAFEKCQKLETINIPENVTYIGSEAFSECKKLKEITLPSSLKGIGKRAFFGCVAITSMSFPDSLKSLPEEVCRVCFGLKEVKLPEHITKIPRYAFRGCKNLVSINLPAELTTIGEEAFASCLKLKDFDPTFVENLGSFAFKGTVWEKEFMANASNGPLMFNNSILYAYIGDTPEELSIRSGIKTIMSNAFNGKETLKRVTIESETIGSMAFYGCKNLEKMTLTDNVKKLGIKAFAECTALKDTTISKSLSCIEESVFKGDTSLVEVVLPEGVNKIGLGAFANCTNLESLEIFGKQCKTAVDLSIFYIDDYGISSDESEFLKEHGGTPFYGSDKLIIYSYPSFLNTNDDLFTYGDFSRNNFNSLCAKHDDFEHTRVYVYAQKSTCTKQGHNSYYCCEYCKKPLTEYISYPLEPHRIYEDIKGKAPTCTEDGYTSLYKCRVCHQTIQELTIIPATGHSLVTVPAVSATETKTGLTEGAKCTVCGEWEQRQKVIPRIGDVYGDLSGDKKINGSDAGLLNRYVSGWVTGLDKLINIEYADINQDGKVNGGDAAVLARYVSGWQGYESYFEN